MSCCCSGQAGTLMRWHEIKKKYLTCMILKTHRTSEVVCVFFGLFFGYCFVLFFTIWGAAWRILVRMSYMKHVFKYLTIKRCWWAECCRDEALAHLGLVEVHSIHGELLGVLQEHQVSLGWSHHPGNTPQHSLITVTVYNLWYKYWYGIWPHSMVCIQG